MAQAFYLTDFEKQLTGTVLASSNCGAASGAMLVGQGTLGALDPGADAFRRNTGDYTGGLFIGTIGNTCEVDYKVGVTVFDGMDGLTWAKLLAYLKAGRFAVVNGDYDQVPLALRGDKDFTGLHSVMYHQVNSAGTMVRVGDPLNDGRRPGIPKGWVWWPISVAKNYVEKYDREVPGTGLHAAVLDRKRLRARPVAPATNIRSAPSMTSSIIGKFGGTQTVIWGVKVVGQKVGNSTIWYRVWCPTAARVGFCHSSVVTVV